MDKVVELVGGGTVINGAYPVLFPIVDTKPDLLFVQYVLIFQDLPEKSR